MIDHTQLSKFRNTLSFTQPLNVLVSFLHHCEDWSPEQISRWLNCESQMTVSHESIYQFILKDKFQGGNLYLHLRCKKQPVKQQAEKMSRL